MKTRANIKCIAGLPAIISFRRLSLLVILWFSSTALLGQEYIPMAVEGAQWIIRYDDIDTPQPVDDLWEYFASGDTTIESDTFRKVYRRNLVTTNDPPPFEASGNYELYGLIRDDILNRQVYAILYNDNQFCPEYEEILLYDFSLEPDDTADFCIVPEHVDFVIESITPATFLEFETTVFSDGMEYNYYEGVGSGFGLFEPMFIAVKSGGGKSLYQTYLYYYCRETPCNLVLSTNELSARSQMFEIFPNPAQNDLNVVLPETIGSGHLVLVNAQGQIVRRKSIQESASEVNFNLNDLPAGLYTIAVLREEAFIMTKKFIISR